VVSEILPSQQIPGVQSIMHQDPEEEFMLSLA
jgi:hypothetical protein